MNGGLCDGADVDRALETSYGRIAADGRDAVGEPFSLAARRICRAGRGGMVQRRVFVEFSLALNNRTGKYFALKDVIAAQARFIDSLLFWRVRLAEPPSRIASRVLGRLMMWEIIARTRYPTFDRMLPRMSKAHPILFTDPLQVLLHRLKARDVVVVHDLGPLTHPQFYARGVGHLYKLIYEEVERAAPHLVFVSEATRDQFVARFGSAFRSMQVIYNPIRLEALEGRTVAPAGVEAPFMLSVGALGRRKNQLAMLRAFAASGLGERGHSLVLCGGTEPGAEAVLRELEATPGALHLGYASAEELRWLYQNAEAFVLPSHLEGFGMPAGEALGRGLLPILSRDPALMEVAGEGAIYCDDDDPGSIARAMGAFVDMSIDHRRSLVEKGRAGIDRFSPEAVQRSWRLLFERLCREE